MTDDEFERCMRVLRSVRADHNWRHYTTQAGIIRTAWDVEVHVRDEMATFDNDELTKLVLAAHQERVRVSISGRMRYVLTLRLTPRKSEGGRSVFHPGMERLTEATA